VLTAAVRAVEVFTRLFGPAPSGAGFTVIEIPEGWGSQAGDGYILQTAAAFRDPARRGELYHEIAHSWHMRAAPGVQETRWFDEAFASYFQALAEREIEGPGAFAERMEAYRRSFLRSAERDGRSAETPIRAYGAAGLGRNSYTKGAWSLYVLHGALGEEAFRSLVRRLLHEHAQEPADFESFRRALEAEAGRPMDRFFTEWIDGAESSRLLAEGLPIGELAARYGAAGR
jgi:aminopeptidase N